MLLRSSEKHFGALLTNTFSGDVMANSRVVVVKLVRFKPRYAYLDRVYKISVVRDYFCSLSIAKAKLVRNASYYSLPAFPDGFLTLALPEKLYILWQKSVLIYVLTHCNNKHIH